MKRKQAFVKRGCLARRRVGQILLIATFSSCAAWGQVQSAFASAVADSDPVPSLSIPAEVPLRLEITQTLTLQAGKPFRGKLTEPVYGPNRLLLPAGTVAEGVISDTPAADRSTRVNAKLDGDFTPLRVPVVRVTQLLSPSGVILPVDAVGTMRNAATISLGAHPPPSSIMDRMKAMVHEQIQQVRDMIHNPHKGDWAKQLLYSQLPYHPQRVWAGSQFDAVLREPLRLPLSSASAPIPAADDVDLTSGTMQARLTAGISSATSKKGDPVSAVLVKPFCNPQGKLMLPSGTSLNGVVLQARPARSFARNGRLRFSFRSVGTSIAAGAGQHIESNLSSIQGQKGQNVTLDEEGGTRAQPDKGRVLAPLVLGVLAAAAANGDNDDILRHGVTSNGFGFAARIVTMATSSRDASLGFAIYATGKSIYRRYIATGHQLSFPTNTELSINLSRR
jgi:hypothetical protein